MFSEHLIDFARILEGMHKALCRVIEPLIEGVRQLASVPPALGYEEYWTGHNDPPAVARFWGLAVPHIGRRLFLEQQVRRAASMHLARIAKATSVLTTRNQGKKLLAALKPLGGLPELHEICEHAQVSASDLERLLRVENDHHAGALRELAGRIVASMKLPRGPKPKLVIETHRALLLIADERGLGFRYTYRPDQEGCSDEGTKATRVAFGKPQFDPRGAVAKLKREGDLT